jgi:hypothetical protein
MDLFAIDLANEALTIWPEEPDVWRPEPEPGADVRALLGRWWSEGNEFVFRWDDGKLRAKVVGTPPGRAETTFERDADGWVAAAGRERGERLFLRGDALVWAGYEFTRDQRPFKA